ncbi:MAG: YfcE family phosphodiesterase [Candidatus Helarchaeota archaeon]
MRILVIGDFHIPDRAQSIPTAIFQEIHRNKFDLLLCTGDLTEANLLHILRSIAPIKVVMGNMDYYFGLRDLPRSQIIVLKYCKIGLTHGTGIRPRGNPEQLSKLAHEFEVDILISGHVHAFSLKLHKDILLLNPGSATGSWGGGPSNKIPSFVILEEVKEALKIQSFQLKHGKLMQQLFFFDLKDKQIRI